MGIIAWAVVGLLAGGLARIVTGSEKRGCLGTMAVGLLGSLIGGALANWAWDEKITDFGLESIIISALGAALLLFALQAVGIGDRR
jgi:uncharacterized membrane protein YeaQ/YmgE (transglycosylase-associated protein family)